MTEPNPYAPPPVSMDTRRSEVPIPDGVRRFRLDPPRYDKFTLMVLAQQLVVSLTLLVPLYALLAVSNQLSTRNVVVLGVMTMGWIVIARLVRIRSTRKTNLDTYELLVSERAARRNLSGFVSAEFLRPELTKTYEVPTGIWLISEPLQHSLFIANAVDHYADAYATFASWGEIKKLSGITAWNFARKQARRQGLRDLMMGTALASDAMLLQELTVLRSISTTGGRAQLRSQWSPLLRAVGFWFGLIILFVAVWQFLAPNGR